LEQAPVSLREPLEEFADFEVIAGHGPDQGDQVLAHVLGHSFLIHLNREVVAALRGVLVEGTLEKVQRLANLALELGLAELEEFGLFAHKYAYIHAYL